MLCGQLLDGQGKHWQTHGEGGAMGGALSNLRGTPADKSGVRTSVKPWLSYLRGDVVLIHVYCGPAQRTTRNHLSRDMYPSQAGAQGVGARPFCPGCMPALPTIGSALRYRCTERGLRTWSPIPAG
jgi:hypothetical protein